MKLIDYPFNSAEILRKKKTLKRQLLNQNDLQKIRIAILSGSTIGDIKDVLEVFLLSFGLEPQFFVGQYNRFYEDIVFENKELAYFSPDLIYIHTTTRNLSDESCMDKLQIVWRKIKEDYSCPIIQNNFELPVSSTVADCRKINILNVETNDHAEENSDFYINDIQYLSAFYGLENWFDEQNYYLYKYAFSVNAIPLICHNIAKIIKSLFGKNQKCIVLDLDNTLWGGIVGEVGVTGIELGMETALGEAYSEFQRYLKKLHERGVILAVCSKNDESIAKAAFQNQNMILQLEDITVFRANWGNKAENIAHIAKQLNISPESIVFVDDSPAERELVRCALPGIMVPEVGSVIDFIPHIEGAGYFYITSISSDDLSRNEFYSADTKRNDAKNTFTDYGKYLHSLQMSSKIQPFDSSDLDRITQLINKTNQFNLTTKRYSLSEIKNIAANGKFVTLYATLDDKFGSNGIVSAFIGETLDEAMHIRLWVMSCRVFKRDLEFAVFDRLVEICVGKGLTKLVGYYFKTEKNGFVANLFSDIGFSKVAEDTWEFDLVAKYQCKSQYIKLEEAV